jgi:hypothetical protein
MNYILDPTCSTVLKLSYSDLYIFEATDCLMLPHQADVSEASKYAKALINYLRFGSLNPLTFEWEEQSLGEVAKTTNTFTEFYHSFIQYTDSYMFRQWSAIIREFLGFV